MHDFFSAAKSFLKELGDLTYLVTYVVLLIVSCYKYVRWKIDH